MEIFRKKLAMILAILVAISSIMPLNMFAEESNETVFSGDEVVSVMGGITNSGNYFDEVTYQSASDSITYAIKIKEATLGDTVVINLPVGVDLVSAPGLEINSLGEITSKDYLASTEASYFDGSPNYTVDDSINGYSTKSGTIEYNLKDVEGIEFIIVTKVNSAFVPFTMTSQIIELGAVQVEVGTDSDEVTVFVKTQETDLKINDFIIQEYVSSPLSAYSEKLTSTYIAEDRTYDIIATIKSTMNASIEDSIINYKINKMTFMVTCPTDVVITPRIDGIFTSEFVSEQDGISTYKITLDDTYSSSSLAINFSDLMIFDFSNVAGNDVEGTEFSITASNLTFNVRSFDVASQTFEEVEITESNLAKSGIVLVSSEVDNSKYAISYITSYMNTEEMNPYTGVAQTLYQTRRSIGVYNTDNISGLSAGTTEPILMQFESFPDETKGYLDNVSSVIMRVPFLGEEGIEQYASQLVNITVWYESDDISDLGITSEAGHTLDISDFETAMLSGTLTADNILTAYQVDSTGIVTYSFTSSETPYFTITAPAGESIVKISAEFTGDNSFYLNSSKALSTVYGTPKLDGYTGDYSAYEFGTYTQNSEGTWSLKSKSSAGGFRWQEPAPFELTATDTSLKSSFYYYNVTKYDTYINADVYKVHKTTGYQNLGSISISNESGTPLYEDTYLVMEFIADPTSSDVIKEIVFPMCPDSLEDSILVIAYEYANGAKYYYSSDTDATKPYEIEGTQGIIKASGDNAIVKFEIAFTSWGTVQDEQAFEVYGYIEDTSDLDREDKHYLGYDVYDINGEIIENLGANTTINSTFEHITQTGADVRILGLETTEVSGNSYSVNNLVAGRSGEVQFELFGGAINNILNGYWNEITFNIVLPTGVTLDQVSGVQFSFEKDGVPLTYPTDELIGHISIEETTISQSEAEDYFDIHDGTIKGATIYTCTLDDEEAILYGIRAGSQGNAFSKMTISATITPDSSQAKTLLPWSKVLLLGSNCEDYTSFTKIAGSYGVAVATGQAMDNLSGDLQTGVTSTIVTGSDDEYLYIDSVPELMVHNLNISTGGENYVYSESNQDSVAILHAGDTGTLSYTVTNTVNDDSANQKDNYVAIALPKGMNATGSLTTTSDFNVIISKITVNNIVDYGANLYTMFSNAANVLSDEMSIETGYINSQGVSLKTYSDIETAFNGSEDDYDDDENYDLMILKLNSQEPFSSFDVQVDFVMPTHVTTTTEYVEFQAMSAYYSTSATKLVFDSEEDGASIIKFGYENPEWIIDVIPVKANDAGYITGTMAVDIDDLNVLHNGVVYNTEKEDEQSLIAPNVVGYTFEGWYIDEDLTELAFQDNADYFTVTNDMEVYACYTINKVEVTYDFNNEEVNLVKEVDWDTSISNPTSPYKQGHTFTGWYSDEECQNLVSESSYGEIAENDAAITIYAGYSVNPTYQVVYNVDGVVDAIVDEELYEALDVVTISSSVPTKTGYVFSGWLFNGTIYQPSAIVAMSHGDMQFVAEWSHETYTISYQDLLENTLLDDSEVKYTESIILPAPANKEGYSFEYWAHFSIYFKAGDEFTMPYDDVTLYAHYKVNAYTIEFTNVNQGELENVDYDNYQYTMKLNFEEDSKLPTPQREGYDFLYWSYETNTYSEDDLLTMPAKNISLEAVWEVKEYEVSYDVNGGQNIDTNEYDFGEIITLPTPVREGYDFLHWEDENEGEYVAGNSYAIPSKDTEFSAIWRAKPYILTFKDEGIDGHVYFIEDINYDETITLPTPEREGYDFSCWIYDEEEYSAGDDFKMEVASNIDIIAEWDIIEYEITFDVSDVVNQEYFDTIYEDYNIDVILPTEVPEREGYEFVCWTDGKDNYEPGQVVAMPEDGLDLGIKWTILEFEISYSNTGSSTIDTRDQKYGTIITLPSAVKTGYDFMGWRYDGELYLANEDFTVPANDVEFVGEWDIHEYDVVFDYGYGGLSDTTIHAYGDIIQFDSLERDGYTFAGWVNEGSIYKPDQTFTLQSADTSFEGAWVLKEYTVSFDNTGDTVIDSVILEYLQTSILPTPTKTGYTFVGWEYEDQIYNKDTVFTVPSTDVQFVGQWDLTEYEVTFAYGYDEQEEVKNIEYQSMITFEEIIREGYTFNGWVYDEKLYTTLDEVQIQDDDMHFEASWTINEYDLIFKDTGDTVLEDVVVAYNDNHTLPTVTKAGYTFISWVDTNGNTYEAREQVVMEDQNLELTAQWEQTIIVDEVEDVESTNTEDNQEVSDFETPNTGDNSNVVMWMIIMVCTLMLTTYIVPVKNHKRK